MSSNGGDDHRDVHHNGGNDHKGTHSDERGEVVVQSQEHERGQPLGDETAIDEQLHVDHI